MNAGIGMVPEDRKEAGLFLAMSIAANTRRREPATP